jgi:nitrogen regulatory protein PII
VTTAKTDKIGDGKIFVLDIQRRARADRRNQRRRALSAPFHEKDH